MERYDLYNRKGEPLGKKAARNDKLSTGEYFLIVHVWIETAPGEYLIHQRNKPSDPTPYQWATVSGMVAQNEPPARAAVRETKEELGIGFIEADLSLLSRIITENAYNTFAYIYRVRKHVDPSTLVLERDEVRAVDTASLEEILRMVREGDFWDYASLLEKDDYFSLLKGRE